MMKVCKAGLVILLSLTILACSEEDQPQEDGEFLRQDFQSFTIDIPSNWRKIFAEDFANTLPKETVALFLRRIEGSDFIQNVNVAKESLNTEASSLEYAKANVLLGSKALIDYRPLSNQEVTVDEILTVLHLFRARNATTEPLRHYTQGYFAQDGIGYTVTCIAQDENLDQQALCASIVRSFRLK